MATLSDLQARLEALRKARASGVTRVYHTSGSGVSRSVEYRTDAEMAAAIADIERQIAAATGTPVRTVYISASKGI